MHDVNVLDAFRNFILRDCRDNSLGTCLVFELQRFVEALEMNEQIAKFQIKDIFRKSRFEEGLPKSIILQTDRIANFVNESDSRLPSLNASMQKF